MNILSREEIIPLTPQAAGVLLALAGGPKHGYALAQFCDSDSGGVLDVSVGSLYHLIKRLSEQRFIEGAGSAEAVASPYKRKLYKLTSNGRKVLEWEMERQAAFTILAKYRLKRYDLRANAGV